MTTTKANMARRGFGLVALVGLAVVIWLDCKVQGASAIRYSGLFLQLLGMGAAAIGIHDAGRQFDKASVLQRLAEHFPLRPRDPPKPQTLAPEPIKAGAVSATAALCKGRNPKAPVAKQVETLDENLRDLVQQVTNAKGCATEARHEAARAADLGKRQRDRDIHSIRRLIEQTATDGLPLAATGIGLAALGSILATLSEDLVRLLAF